MQPGPVPEDIDSILSRFHSWAEKKPAANGNGSAQRNGGPPDEVREVAYEEAIREHLNRRGSQNGKPAAPRKKAAAGQASSTSAAPEPQLEEVAPVQAKKPPFVPSLELLAALRSAAPAPAPREVSPPPEPLQPILFREENESATRSRPTPAAASPVTASSSAASPSLTRAPVAKNPTPAPKTAVASVFREVLADASTATAGAIAPKPRPEPKIPRQNAAVSAQRSAVAALGRAPIAASSRPPVKAAKIVQPAIRAKPAIANTRRTAIKTVAARRSDSISAAKRRKPRPAPFRQVLANTIQQPRLPDAAAKKGMPDRTRRITTRFTTAEERRIEKQASLLGLTVSAYLRHCALATVTPPAEPAPPPTMSAARNKLPQRTAQSAYPPNPYAAQGSSLIGWLALLRNRFLGPPIQFSDDA